MTDRNRSICPFAAFPLRGWVNLFKMVPRRRRACLARNRLTHQPCILAVQARRSLFRHTARHGGDGGRVAAPGAGGRPAGRVPHTRKHGGSGGQHGPAWGRMCDHPATTNFSHSACVLIKYGEFPGRSYMMETDTIDSEIIDPDLDSYRQFFDHAWCGHIIDLVEHSPLKPAVGTLMLAWRSTDGAHRLPWLMVEQLRCFGEGEVKGSLRYRNGYFPTVVKGISEKLEAWTPSMSFQQRTEQRRAVARIEEGAAQALKTAQSQVRFNVEQYWTQLIGHSEFVFCLLGLQRTNYGSLFFAYEDFLANTIRTREPTYSSRNTSIKKRATRSFWRAACRLLLESCRGRSCEARPARIGPQRRTLGSRSR